MEQLHGVCQCLINATWHFSDLGNFALDFLIASFAYVLYIQKNGDLLQIQKCEDLLNEDRVE